MNIFLGSSINREKSVDLANIVGRCGGFYGFLWCDNKLRISKYGKTLLLCSYKIVEKSLFSVAFCGKCNRFFRNDDSKVRKTKGRVPNKLDRQKNTVPPCLSVRCVLEMFPWSIFDALGASSGDLSLYCKALAPFSHATLEYIPAIGSLCARKKTVRCSAFSLLWLVCYGHEASLRYISFFFKYSYIFCFSLSRQNFLLLLLHSKIDSVTILFSE